MIYPQVPVIFNVRHPVCNIASIIGPNADRGWSFDQIIQWYKCFHMMFLTSLGQVYFLQDMRI